MDTSVLIFKLGQVRSLVEECLNTIQGDESPQAEGTAPILPPSLPSVSVDFSTPVRPFMKAFVGLSGGRKFALLLAWMAKGELDKQIALSEIELLWSSMSGMLNLRFNRRFTSDAKDSDWVNSTKKGFYYLRPNWKQALNGTTK